MLNVCMLLYNIVTFGSPYIMVGLHLKSFIKITSAFSAPTQANDPVAGLQNVLKIIFKGERIKVFPVFAGP